MNIVTNNTMLRFFKKINIFKIDLGFNLKGSVNMKAGKGPEPTIKIRDEFIKKFQTMNGNKFIRKYGEIGSLKFYEDSSVLGMEFHVYDNDKIYEIEASSEDLLKDAGVYLTEVLKMIEDGVEDTDEDPEFDMIKNVSYSNIPEDVLRPDIKLPRDQYIDAMIKRKKLLDKL